MGRPLIDISGKRFGRFVAIEHIYKGNKWRCRCDCGTEKVASGYHLRSGMVRSCGCLNSEMSAARQFKHGQYGTPEYLSWRNAKRRCVDPRDKRFAQYGGRGIKMCQDWMGSFETFLRDVGKRPSSKHSLDRYPDQNGNYEPGNVRWATPLEQANNMTRNRLIEWRGRTMTLSQWARELGFGYHTLYQRFLLGWPVEKALTEPLHQS